MRPLSVGTADEVDVELEVRLVFSFGETKLALN